MPFHFNPEGAGVMIRTLGTFKRHEILIRMRVHALYLYMKYSSS
jgi:hypothetical protein